MTSAHRHTTGRDTVSNDDHRQHLHPISEAQRAQRVAASAHGNAAQKAQREIDPHYVGRRTVLAKTCTECGELRPGSAFRHHSSQPGSQQDSACARCYRRRAYELVIQDDEKRRVFHKRANRMTKRANDAMPKPRNGYLWTGPEMEIIERDDLTARQAALMIGRSLMAVRQRRQAIRREPKLQRVLGAQN